MTNELPLAWNMLPDLFCNEWHGLDAISPDPMYAPKMLFVVCFETASSPYKISLLISMYQSQKSSQMKLLIDVLLRQIQNDANKSVTLDTVSIQTS